MTRAVRADKKSTRPHMVRVEVRNGPKAGTVVTFWTHDLCLRHETSTLPLYASFGVLCPRAVQVMGCKFTVEGTVVKSSVRLKKARKPC